MNETPALPHAVPREVTPADIYMLIGQMDGKLTSFLEQHTIAERVRRAVEKEHDDRISALERFRSRLIGTVSGVTLLSGLVMGLLELGIFPR